MEVSGTTPGILRAARRLSFFVFLFFFLEGVRGRGRKVGCKALNTGKASVIFFLCVKV